MELFVTKNMEELCNEAADWITDHIENTLKSGDRFTLALSGGNTPKKLYQLLAGAPYKDRIDWSKLHFFWGDERAVPFNDDRNNGKMAFDHLLNQVPVKKDQVHLMRTDIEPADAALEYEEILHRYFDGKDHTFDLVLLGLGNDAHTLSLFPGNELVLEKNKWVQSFYLEEQEMSRITLTSPVVNLADRVLFLVSGTDKAIALEKVLSGEYDPLHYPAQSIQPVNGKIYWMMDIAAAANLQ